MTEQTVKLTASFTAEQVAEAIVGWFKLPADSEVDFKLVNFCTDPRDYDRGEKKFSRADVKFKKKLGEVL